MESVIADKERLLRENKQIDPALVRGFERLSEELDKLGVNTDPRRYSLTPPLGGGAQTLKFHNRIAG